MYWRGYRVQPAQMPAFDHSDNSTFRRCAQACHRRTFIYKGERSNRMDVPELSDLERAANCSIGPRTLAFII